MENDRPAATCPGFQRCSRMKRTIDKFIACPMTPIDTATRSLLDPFSGIKLEVDQLEMSLSLLYGDEKKKRLLSIVYRASGNWTLARRSAICKIPFLSSSSKRAPIFGLKKISKRKRKRGAKRILIPIFLARGNRQLTSLHLLVRPLIFPYPRLISFLLPNRGNDRENQ